VLPLPEDRNRKLYEDFEANLIVLPRRVAHIWDRPTVLPHFTRHGPDHCGRVEGHLEVLIKPLTQPLNLAESYILQCAVWTHDIGMQDARFALIDLAKSTHGMDQETTLSADITALTSKHYNAIRKGHAEASATWILSKPGDLGLADDAYLAPIARVARAHSNYDGLEEMEDIHIGAHDVRMRLLAVLLIVADELDLDKTRVNMEALQRIDIPVESKLHWWCHHYVDAVRIESLTPYIYLSLPEEYNGLQTTDWGLRATAGLRKQLARHVVRDTLLQEGVALHNPEIKLTVDNVKLPWPREILLDTRAAVQAEDIALIRDFPSTALFNMMNFDLYGIPLANLTDGEQDRLVAACIRLHRAWKHIGLVHYDFLFRTLQDKVNAVLADIDIHWLTKTYLLYQAALTLRGHFGAKVLPTFGVLPSWAETPGDDLIWQAVQERVEKEYGLAGAQTINWDEARGRAARERPQHQAEVDCIDHIVEDVCSSIVIAAVIHNGMARLDDRGTMLAFAQTALVWNGLKSGPLTAAAVAETLQDSENVRREIDERLPISTQDHMEDNTTV